MKRGWKTTMYVSESGIAMIKHFEGFRNNAYKCPSGVWTIGYGHTQNVKEGDVITEETANNLLLIDINSIYGKYVNDVLRDRGIFAEQCEFDALVSFAYNCGCGAFITLVRCINDSYNEYVRDLGEPTEKEQESFFNHQFSDRMAAYNKSNGVILVGLVRRRQTEIDIFVNGWGDEYALRGASTICTVDDNAVVMTSPRGFKKANATKDALSGGVEILGTVPGGWVAVRCRGGETGYINREYIDTQDCVVKL